MKRATRNKLGPLGAAEKAACDRLLAHADEVCDRAIAVLRETPREARGKWFLNSLAYWKNAQKFARWLRKQNAARRVMESIPADRGEQLRA